jgi:hypothetical protein
VNRASVAIDLQHENAWAMRGIWIVHDHQGGIDPSQYVRDENTIIRELIVAMHRYSN